MKIKIAGFSEEMNPNDISNKFDELATDYQNDAEFRTRLDNNPRDVLKERGLELPPLELQISVNTSDTFHLVLPPDPNVYLQDESLNIAVGAGSTAGTASTVGSASTMSSIPSCAGTLASGACAGCAGTAGGYHDHIER